MIMHRVLTTPMRLLCERENVASQTISARDLASGSAVSFKLREWSMEFRGGTAGHITGKLKCRGRENAEQNLNCQNDNVGCSFHLTALSLPFSEVEPAQQTLIDPSPLAGVMWCV